MTDTAATTAADTVTVANPTTEATAGVKELAKAYEFIKSGISHLGEAAEGELLALAKNICSSQKRKNRERYLNR